MLSGPWFPLGLFSTVKYLLVLSVAASSSLALSGYNWLCLSLVYWSRIPSTVTVFLFLYDSLLLLESRGVSVYSHVFPVPFVTAFN